MEIDCPHGWKTIIKTNKITWEDTTVEIHGGMCDAAHHCGITTCKFYDISPAGDARFIVALRKSETLEGLLEQMQRH